MARLDPARVRPVYEAQADAVDGWLAGLRDDELGLPSLPGWTVAALVAHVGQLFVPVVAALAADRPARSVRPLSLAAYTAGYAAGAAEISARDVAAAQGFSAADLRTRYAAHRAAAADGLHLVAPHEAAAAVGLDELLAEQGAGERPLMSVQPIVEQPGHHRGRVVHQVAADQPRGIGQPVRVVRPGGGQQQPRRAHAIRGQHHGARREGAVAPGLGITARRWPIRPGRSVPSGRGLASGWWRPPAGHARHRARSAEARARRGQPTPHGPQRLQASRPSDAAVAMAESDGHQCHPSRSKAPARRAGPGPSGSGFMARAGRGGLAGSPCRPHTPIASSFMANQGSRSR